MAKQCYSINSSLILICIQLISLTLEWAIDDCGCRTPDGGVGCCNLIDDCEPIKTFQNSVAPSREVMKTIESYYCGVNEKLDEFRVCCPNNTIIPSLVTRSKTEVEPPDVTNHKNAHLLPYECGLQPGGSRIKDGENAVLYEFPWMALLYYETRKGPEFRCGGTIINEKYILTAAHCITNLFPVKLISVRVGEYNISSELDCDEPDNCAPPVQNLLIDEVIPHPSYNFTTYTSDIGLLRLAEPIAFNDDSIKSICLPFGPELRNKTLIDDKVTVTGWGAAENGRKLEVLQKVVLPVVFGESCVISYEKTPVVIDGRQICAGGDKDGDPCGGDSGGPLQKAFQHNNDLRYIQFGVVSVGPRFCGQREGLPSAYTGVNYYMDWILNNLKP